MRAVVVVTFALALGATAPAAADGPSAEAEAAALRELDRGIAAYRARDFATAHAAFTAAHDLVPERANPYRWLALTEVELGDCAAALPHIDGFVARVAADDARLPELVRLRAVCHRTLERPAPAEPVPATTAAPTRWWLWAAIGGAALVVAGGIVYATTRDTTTTLPPIRCDSAGCAP